MQTEEKLNELLALFQEDDETIGLLLEENVDEQVLVRKLIHKQLNDNIETGESYSNKVKIFDDI